MKELFGQRLREQRIKHGLTLEQLAEKSELSSNYIGMVERGLKEPGLATIVKLLNALNISADTLLCDLVPSRRRGLQAAGRLDSHPEKSGTRSAGHLYRQSPLPHKRGIKSQTLQAHRLKFSRCAFLLHSFRL